MTTSTMPNPGILRLQGVVQRYAWGGYSFIPNLLGVGNPVQEPFAELWIGAHPSAPSIACMDGHSMPLDRLIARAPEVVLGRAARARFLGRLPYLLKILDARQMLSIQVHPTRQQARAGFGREEAGGVPLKAPERSYKDDNHKPEVHVALTDFWMLHGFRPLEEIVDVLGSVAELSALAPGFGRTVQDAGPDPAARADALRDLYVVAMTLPQERVNAMVDPLIARLERERPQNRNSPDFWALRAAQQYPLPSGGRDRGILSIYLLNLVHLRPGQGTFQPAGVLHAYLEGTTVELMASSDNVLRGGLTPKHIDVGELLTVVEFAQGRPEILEGAVVDKDERVYGTPAEEFVLSCVAVPPTNSHALRSTNGPDVLIVTEGSALLRWHGGELALEQGGIALVPFGVSYTVETGVTGAVLFRAAVP